MLPIFGSPKSVCSGVTRRDLLQMLPYSNGVAVFNVSGATLRAALANAISTLGEPAGTKPSGRFLQLSSALRFEWYRVAGRPTVGAIQHRVHGPDKGFCAIHTPDSRVELAKGDWLPKEVIGAHDDVRLLTGEVER